MDATCPACSHDLSVPPRPPSLLRRLFRRTPNFPRCAVEWHDDSTEWGGGDWCRCAHPDHALAQHSVRKTTPAGEVVDQAAGV